MWSCAWWGNETRKFGFINCRYKTGHHNGNSKADALRQSKQPAHTLETAAFEFA